MQSLFMLFKDLSDHEFLVYQANSACYVTLKGMLLYTNALSHV